MMPNRRAFLKSVAGGLALTTFGSTSVTASRNWGEISNSSPEYITRSFEKPILNEYKPLLVTRDLGSNTPSALYSYVARSSEFDSTVLVYWAKYPFQDGTVPGGWDSHFGDTEPIYVEIDEGRDEILGVSYSAYHWLRGWTPTPPVATDSEGTHPLLHVVDPWHHYFTTAEEGVAVGLEELDDSTLSSWWENGWNEAINPRTLTVPWIMTGVNGAEDWWHNSTAWWSYEATLRRVYLSAGFFGAEGVDI